MSASAGCFTRNTRGGRRRGLQSRLYDGPPLDAPRGCDQAPRERRSRSDSRVSVNSGFALERALDDQRRRPHLPNDVRPPPNAERRSRPYLTNKTAVDTRA